MNKRVNTIVFSDEEKVINIPFPAAVRLKGKWKDISVEIDPISAVLYQDDEGDYYVVAKSSEWDATTIQANNLTGLQKLKEPMQSDLKRAIRQAVGSLEG